MTKSIVFFAVGGLVLSFVTFPLELMAEDQFPQSCIPDVERVFTAKVIKVSDGDTVTVLDANKESIRVRLEGIDAPEDQQDHGTRSKQALASWIFGKEVEVQVTGVDQYNRTLGHLYLNEENINLRMIREGWAWHYDYYNCDPSFAAAQRFATAEKRGLWEHPNPISPYEYRTRQRKKAALAKLKTEPSVPIKYWLNSSSGVRHNETCAHFQNTKRGRECTESEGKPCGICGG